MAAVALAGDVVVLKGGSVIPLKQPWVRRGNTAYLTRADGTLLSVPVTEIDAQATAAASHAPAEPPPAAAPAPDATTPADAARVKRESPKAKVRITDADVSHPMDLSPAAPPAKTPASGQGSARVEISQYNQELHAPSLSVKGELRNPTQTTAQNIKLLVSAIDSDGSVIDAQPASLANGDLEPGETTDFGATLTVGEHVATSLRFAPSWSAPRPPLPAPAPKAPASNGARSRSSR